MSFDKIEHLEHAPTAHLPGITMPPEKHISLGKLLIVLMVAAVIIAAVIYVGIKPRIAAQAALKVETDEMAAPTVGLVHPVRGAPAQEIILSGSTEAFTIAPIYARTSGYLKKWYADIGTHVKAGALLAEIESPEVDQQLLQARADVSTAEANLKLAKITTQRYTQLQTEGVVAKQVADNVLSDEEAKVSIMRSAQANVKRLEQLQSYQKIYAPFDGVITARRTDIGQLVDAGSNGGAGRELFMMSANAHLRVFVSVPQVYSREAVPGVQADLAFAELPGRIFTGHIARTTNLIDQVSRTLRVEIDVDNSKGELLPGAYTEVHLKIAKGEPALLVPVSAVMFRSEGLRVAIVIDGNKAKLLPITLGRDYGNQVEVSSGLAFGQAVIENPPDSLVDAMPVRVVEKKTTMATPLLPAKK